MAPKRLRCFVVGCNNGCNSRNLLPTSEQLKTQWGTFVSPAEEVSIRVFNESLQLPFLITC